MRKQVQKHSPQAEDAAFPWRVCESRDKMVNALTQTTDAACSGLAATLGQADHESECAWHADASRNALPSGPNTVAVQTNRLSSDEGLAEHPAGSSAISSASKVRLYYHTHSQGGMMRTFRWLLGYRFQVRLQSKLSSTLPHRITPAHNL